jgi:3-oxoacyl-[acyl-carrier-protein] synthase II
MICINGIGWINDEEYGCIARDLRVKYEDKKLIKKEIFTIPSRNFGRLDNASKMTCYAAALALKDAGIKYSQNRKHDIGIIGTNPLGCLETDSNYFKDYLDSNRTLSRGNLFIYTLPTSPLGEAAIRFGLQGPVLYIAAAENSLLSVVDMAVEMILLDETSAILAGMSEENKAFYLILKKNHDTGQHILCNIDRAMSILRRNLGFDKMIKEFSVLKKGNGR